MDFNFNEILAEAREKSFNIQEATKHIKKLISKYQELGEEIQEIMELSLKNTDPYTRERNQLENMYYEFLSSTSNGMIDKIKEICDKIAKTQEYKNVVKDLKAQQYRILELTRSLKRSEVFYIISRIFIVNNKPIDKRLAKIFNPFYPNELFKVLVYYFIAGINQEETNKQEISEENT